MAPDQANIDRAKDVYEGLCQRGAELGIVLWHCDLAGNILAAPEGIEHLNEQIQRSAVKMLEMTAPAPVELAAGEWLIPIENRQGSRRIAIDIALLKTNKPEDVGRMSTILCWSRDELVRAERDGRTIDQFSEQLAQAYEETNLLYRMARLLNCADDPLKAVETIGVQLQQVLPFGWLSIRFAARNHGVRELAGRTITAGKPPCELSLLEQLSDPLLNRGSEEGWKKLLHPNSDELAAATGAEVLAEAITHDDQVIGILIAGNKSGPEPELSSFEMQFLDATAAFLGVFHENLARFAEQQETFIGTLGALTASIDAKDRYTCGHSERVGLMASKMAEVLGLDKRLVEQYRIAGLVHDVGKIGVPEAVLTKPGRLTDEEFAQIKLHPDIGYTILKDIPSLAPVLPGVLSHHERWDGKGYPNNLAGEDIPLIARVLALADTFDAMSSNRSYRPALPRQRVLDEIARCAGAQFDPNLAPLFVALDFTEFDQALEMRKTVEQKAA